MKSNFSKTLSCLLTGWMLFSVTACSGQDAPAVGSEADTDTNSSALTDTQTETDVPEVVKDPVYVTLSSEGTGTETQTSGQVLEFTVSCLVGTEKGISLTVPDGVELPENGSLSYDVYLGTARRGAGFLELQVKGMKLMSKTDNLRMKDLLGVCANVEEACDLTAYADGRWYHREIPTASYGAGTVQRLRIALPELQAGENVTCYYDNVQLKDADGNVVYTFDLAELLATNDIAQNSKTVTTIAMTDDPAPGTARLSAYEGTAIAVDSSGAVLSGHDTVDFSIWKTTNYARAGILMGKEDASCMLGWRGYFLAMNEENWLTLYRCDEAVTELAAAACEPAEAGTELKIRMETDGTLFRAYYLDDMEGVTPWPEIEIEIEDLNGFALGYAEVNGSSAKILEATVSDYVSSYVGETFEGPLQLDTEGISFGDPDLLYYDGVYYMYGSDGSYRVFSSTDLIHWENHGACMHIEEEINGRVPNAGDYWAPDVEYHNGKFYMMYTLNCVVGIAVADSPIGPFIPTGVVVSDYYSLDGNLFFDDDGTPYAYYATNRDGMEYGIYGVRLDPETLEPDRSTEVRLIYRTEKWESYDNQWTPWNSGVVEAPYMVKHTGLYYFIYSGSDCLSNYAVGYAISESPLDPFEKYEGSPILVGNSQVHGTAHCSFTESPDGSELYIFYHTHGNLETMHPRKVTFDRLRFAPTESGVDRLEVWGPSTTPQPVPVIEQ